MRIVMAGARGVLTLPQDSHVRGHSLIPAQRHIAQHALTQSSMCSGPGTTTSNISANRPIETIGL